MPMEKLPGFAIYWCNVFLPKSTQSVEVAVLDHGHLSLHLALIAGVISVASAH